MQTPYTVRRGQTWYLRLRIPAELTPILGQHFVRTLRTTDYRQAKSRAASMVGASEAWWLMLRASAMSMVLGKPIDDLVLSDLNGVDHARLSLDIEALDASSRQRLRDKLDDLHEQAENGRRYGSGLLEQVRAVVDVFRIGKEAGMRGAPASTSSQPVPAISADPRAALTLEALLDDFFADRPLSQTTQVSHRQVMRDFHRVVGGKGIGSLTQVDVADYKAWLQSQPGRNGKEKAAHATIEKNLNHVRSMLKWAHEEASILASNPGERVRPPKQGQKEASQPKRLPLEPEHLTKLFASPLFTGCDGPRRWSKAGHYRAPADLRMFLLTMFLAGARTEELPGAGIYDLEGVPCLDLLTTGTKTRAGARLVPIMPELRKVGFLTWARQRIAGGGTLFEGADAPSDWSQWTGRYFDSIGIDDPLLTPYSLRHSFKVMMRGGNLNTETMNRIFGHEEGTTGEIYGQGLLTVKEARAFLKAVKASVDLSHLYVTR